MTNFDLFRLKQAGMSNLFINRFLAFILVNKMEFSSENLLLLLPKFIRQANMRHKALFWEKFRQLDLKHTRKCFLQFPSISILDHHYPMFLKESYNPPVLLFYQGDISLLRYEKLGFVGSRSCSMTGISSVQKVIKELNNKFVIISGLARGIDTACHVSAIKNGGKTIAVIGTGLDVHYPKENKQLQTYISKNHLVLSEYSSGEQALKYHFPERNRVIAGLSRGVVVTEAKIRSGSLITCEYAMAEGRDVFAIPGDITDGRSDGCHRLIQQGAKLVYQGQDILTEYL